MSGGASMTKSIFTERDLKILSGKGIDIGCGNDPIFPNVKQFDIDDGDANEISKYVNEEFDFVFSSHCLEHMYNPYKTIQEWWKLVRGGGYMYVLVPDEDLYEQGVFPSTYNGDHKHTFTIYKKHSWNSSLSVNIFDLIKTLRYAKIIKVELQDKNYDYTKNREDQTRKDALAQICFILKKEKPRYYDNIKYPKIVCNLICFFIPKRKNRRHFRMKYAQK